MVIDAAALDNQPNVALRFHLISDAGVTRMAFTWMILPYRTNRLNAPMVSSNAPTWFHLPMAAGTNPVTFVESADSEPAKDTSSTGRQPGGHIHRTHHHHDVGLPRRTHLVCKRPMLGASQHPHLEPELPCRMPHAFTCQWPGSAAR